MNLPRIAITIGDPAGIGPEITAKAVASPAVRRVCRPVVIGSAAYLPRLPRGCDFVDLTAVAAKVRPGRESAATGRAAYAYVTAAVTLIHQGLAEALVTAPLSKAALHAAGINFPGHTELLGALTGTDDFAMVMAAERLRTVMVTRHLPVERVGRTLTADEIERTTSLAWRFLKNDVQILRPRIAVCALNPHAGEGGLLGGEEQRIILPAIRNLAKKKIRVDGPLPVDSAWQKMTRGDYDLLVTMYHDQAMIGLKCLAPSKIVNITLGLPFIRTSPGHGTACDIAGKNCADPRPMIEAILSAARLSRQQ